MKRYMLVEWEDGTHHADIWMLLRENYPSTRTADMTDLMLNTEEVQVPDEFPPGGGMLGYLTAYGKIVETAFRRMRTSLRSPSEG